MQPKGAHFEKIRSAAKLLPIFLSSASRGLYTSNLLPTFNLVYECCIYWIFHTGIMIKCMGVCKHWTGRLDYWTTGLLDCWTKGGSMQEELGGL